MATQPIHPYLDPGTSPDIDDEDFAAWLASVGIDDPTGYSIDDLEADYAADLRETALDHRADAMADDRGW